MAILVPVLISGILILVNGLFVAAEFAIIGVRKTRVARLSGQGNRTATRVLDILNDPIRQDRYISTAQLGITLASLGLGMYAEEAFAELLLGPLEVLLHLDEATAHGIAAAMALSLLTSLHVVIGEMVPKSLALHYAEPTVLGISNPMRVSQTLFLPAVWLLNGIGAGILKLLGVPLVEGHARLHSPEELQMIIDDSFQGGQLDQAEKEMLTRVFGFGEHKAYQVMVHRTRVEAYPVDIEERELLAALTGSRHSRFPIYEGDLDHVVGILHLKDLVRQQVHHPQEFDLRALLRRAPVVPEHVSAESLVARFRRLQIHMAVVLDEFGGMAGIVTLEDLVEEVVGEVQDEFDLELPPVHQVKPGEYLLRGDLTIDDLKEIAFLADDLPDVHSVGGLIVAILGTMPQVGDRVRFSGHELVVESTSGRAVSRARLLLPGDRSGEELDS